MDPAAAPIAARKYIGVTPQEDAAYGEKFVEISVERFRWLRATEVYFGGNNRQIFLKNFRRANDKDQYRLKQFFGLTAIEVDRLLNEAPFLQGLRSPSPPVVK